MGRPDYEDSVAVGTGDGLGSSDDVLLDGTSLSSLTGSGSSRPNTALGAVQEGDNGAS